MSRWMYFALALSVLGLLGLSPVTRAQSPPAKETLAEEVVFFEEPNRSKAYEMLASGQMHIYAYGLSDPDLKKHIETSQDITYTLSYGNTWELTINPSGPVWQNGKLNPFAVAPIREALNWLIDRNYIAHAAIAAERSKEPSLCTRIISPRTHSKPPNRARSPSTNA